MKLLPDTHVLLWAAYSPERLSVSACDLLNDSSHTLIFSVASMWEIALKDGLNRDDFRADAGLLRRGLLDNGYKELPVAGEHALAVRSLPTIHRDPFDRMPIAQGIAEGLTLLTADALVARYPGAVRLI